MFVGVFWIVGGCRFSIGCCGCSFGDICCGVFLFGFFFYVCGFF